MWVRDGVLRAYSTRLRRSLDRMATRVGALEDA